MSGKKRNSNGCSSRVLRRRLGLLVPRTPVIVCVLRCCAEQLAASLSQFAKPLQVAKSEPPSAQKCVCYWRHCIFFASTRTYVKMQLRSIQLTLPLPIFPAKSACELMQCEM